MKIYIGSDHRGYQLKQAIIHLLKADGYDVADLGTYTKAASCDYPLVALKVAQKVSKDALSRGILICLSGIGNSIAANKVPGIRAALCYNQRAARLSRAHNDANILVLGAGFVSRRRVRAILKTWLQTPFEGERHLRRVRQIAGIEKKSCRRVQ